MQAPTSPLRSKLAPAAVRLAALWVLGVTSFKLFAGSPNDLPEIIRRHFFGPELNFNLSVAIELSCAFLALLFPRWGWAAMSALMLVFLSVLVYLISIGATSCGCFGGAIKLEPWKMLAIDGSLLAFMLAMRPWSSIQPTKPPLLVIGLALVVAWAAPWIKNPLTQPVPQAPVATGTNGAPAAWSLPPKPWRNWFNLPASTWIGKSIHDTELAIWMDTRAHQTDATWLFYRVTCPHCADHMRRLFNEFDGSQVYVLVRLPEPADRNKSSWLVDQMPPGDMVTLPEEIDWDSDPGTPFDVVLENGIVKSATHSAEE